MPAAVVMLCSKYLSGEMNNADIKRKKVDDLTATLTFVIGLRQLVILAKVCTSFREINSTGDAWEMEKFLWMYCTNI